MQEKFVVAFSGAGGNTCAQVLIFEDNENLQKSKFKPKISINLDGAEISCPSSTSSDSASKLAEKRESGVSVSSSCDYFSFSITLGDGAVHTFYANSDNERLRWIKLLKLLATYPFSPIPKEPKVNPIKDSFRRSLDTKQYGAGKLNFYLILLEIIETITH